MGVGAAAGEGYVDDESGPRLVPGVGVLVALVLGLVGCGWFRAEGDDRSNAPITAADEMRPVPTVADVPATLAPLGPGETPVTEVVGDPQPDPESPDTLPPLPESPVVNACQRLDDLATAGPSVPPSVRRWRSSRSGTKPVDSAPAR